MDRLFLPETDNLKEKYIPKNVTVVDDILNKIIKCSLVKITEFFLVHFKEIAYQWE
jgi:hypothetical protein